MSRCKPGDLAIVISADNPFNLGRIVKVLELHHGTGPLAMVRDCPVWMVECPDVMMWTDGPEKQFLLYRGPAPDSQLQPLRGQRAIKKKRRKLPEEVKA